MMYHFKYSVTFEKKVSPSQIWEKMKLPLISRDNCAIFVVRLLINWLVNVAQNSIIVLHYFHQVTCVKSFICLSQWTTLSLQKIKTLLYITASEEVMLYIQLGTNV